MKPQIIVVDDGSTDESKQVIQGFGDRVTALFKPNGGMHTAMNSGFTRSIGRVVIFLDADDLLLPDAVESAVNAFCKPEVVHCHWPLQVVDEEGSPTKRLRPEYKRSEGDLLVKLVQSGPDACHFSPTSGNAWSRAFLSAVLPIADDRFRRHAEVCLGTLAPLFGRVVALETLLASYRVHGMNDYYSADLAERNRRNLALFDARCDILAAALAKQRIAFDRKQWERGKNAYFWMSELEEILPRVTAAGSTVLLIDGNEFQGSPSGRTLLSFPREDGVYWGPPESDASAVQALEQEKQAGAKYLVLTWPCFWWRDSYELFCAHLSRYRRAYESERLIVFDVTGL